MRGQRSRCEQDKCAGTAPPPRFSAGARPPQRRRPPVSGPNLFWNFREKSQPYVRRPAASAPPSARLCLRSLNGGVLEGTRRAARGRSLPGAPGHRQAARPLRGEGGRAKGQGPPAELRSVFQGPVVIFFFTNLTTRAMHFLPPLPPQKKRNCSVIRASDSALLIFDRGWARYPDYGGFP